MATAGVPFFSLYGEPPQQADPLYIHVERVRDRVAIHQGRVRPHRHAHLHQLALWSNGDGIFTVEDRRLPLPSAALTIMPAGTVHGFEIGPETNAIVISISDDFQREYLADRADDLVSALRVAKLLALDDATLPSFDHMFLSIEREYQQSHYGESLAIAAYVRLILIGALRLSNASRLVAQGRGRDALVDRYLALVELHFRERWTIDRYVALLGTTPYLLNRSLSVQLGMSASDVVAARTIVEAKRLLLYTALTVAEVAFTLGFHDPSHFGRMFLGATGATPGNWRSIGVARARPCDAF